MGSTTVVRVEALAEAQFGVLTRAQCIGLGMTLGTLRWMVDSRRWQRVHVGVYATHLGSLDWRACVSAALLCCGEGAVASHHAAARLHGLLDRDPDGIEVLIRANRRVASPSHVRLATCVDVARRTATAGWPSRTTVEDTVLDLAACGDADNAIAWLTKAGSAGERPRRGWQSHWRGARVIAGGSCWSMRCSGLAAGAAG